MFRGNRGRGRGGSRPSMPTGPPDTVVEMGTVCHSCENQLFCARSKEQTKIPYFNAPIYLKNKTQIGKVDEILGPMNQLYFTVKTQESIPASSFKKDEIVYISPDKLLPLERFLPKPPIIKAPKQLGLQGMVRKPVNNRRGFQRGGASNRGRFGSDRGGRGGWNNRKPYGNNPNFRRGGFNARRG